MRHRPAPQPYGSERDLMSEPERAARASRAATSRMLRGIALREPARAGRRLMRRPDPAKPALAKADPRAGRRLFDLREDTMRLRRSLTLAALLSAARPALAEAPPK